jgi:hypothetical protein
MRPFDHSELGAHPAAIADLRQHVEYLKKGGFSQEQLLGFYRELENAFEKIRRNPTTWSHAPGSKRARKVQVLRFRLQVFTASGRMANLTCWKWLAPGADRAGAGAYECLSESTFSSLPALCLPEQSSPCPTPPHQSDVQVPQYPPSQERFAQNP